MTKWKMYASEAMLKSYDTSLALPFLKDEVTEMIRLANYNAWKKWAVREAMEIAQKEGWVTTERFMGHCKVEGKMPPDNCPNLWRLVFSGRKRWIKVGLQVNRRGNGTITRWGLRGITDGENPGQD